MIVQVKILIGIFNNSTEEKIRNLDSKYPEIYIYFGAFSPIYFQNNSFIHVNSGKFYYTKPEKQPNECRLYLNMKVEKISCGEAHCVAIIKEKYSNERIIWSWGNNKFGQLGQGSLFKKSTPNPINFLSDYNSKDFDDISCGGFHSLCLINYNEDLSWIENDFKNIICKLINDIGMI